MTKKTKRGRDFLFPHLFITSFNLYNLFRITYCACLTDYCDLHLSRISHLILYLLRNFTRKVFSLLIVNLISTNDYTQLATCLDSIRLRYTDTFHNQKVKLAGTSLLPAIRKQKIQPRDLFFEHQTSCAILSDGWKLVRANGRQPWELIHLTTDPFETQDLSEQFPLKAKELENKWTRWAEQQHVYPFEYRPWTERINYYQSLYPDQKGKEN